MDHKTGQADTADSVRLVKQFQHGDMDAFESFVRCYQDRLYRLACIYLDHSRDAEDATQEVFLRAYQGLPRFRFGSSPFTWLFRVLKNVCSEFNRKHRRNQEISETELQEVLVSEDTADRELRIAEIRRLLELLPRRQRDVMVLRLFEAFSIEQTAQIMRCRPGTVKALQHKAMNRIRGIVELNR